MAEIETPTKSPEVAPPTPSGAADAFEGTYTHDGHTAATSPPHTTPHYTAPPLATLRRAPLHRSTLYCALPHRNRTTPHDTAPRRTPPHLTSKYANRCLGHWQQMTVPPPSWSLVAVPLFSIT